ncbi:hypothetical protein ACFX2F_004489 [Malus domestica]
MSMKSQKLTAKNPSKSDGHLGKHRNPETNQCQNPQITRKVENLRRGCRWVIEKTNGFEEFVTGNGEMRTLGISNRTCKSEGGKGEEKS